MENVYVCLIWYCCWMKYFAIRLLPTAAALLSFDRSYPIRFVLLQLDFFMWLDQLLLIAIQHMNSHRNFTYKSYFFYLQVSKLLLTSFKSLTYKFRVVLTSLLNFQSCKYKISTYKSYCPRIKVKGLKSANPYYFVRERKIIRREESSVPEKREEREEDVLRIREKREMCRSGKDRKKKKIKILEECSFQERRKKRKRLRKTKREFLPVCHKKHSPKC